MQHEKILQVKQLTAKLQIGEHAYPVVQDLSFDLIKGKTLALVGESGCGKTFTALTLMRLLRNPPAIPATGEVIYKDKNLLTLPEHEMRLLRGGKIAMIFQDPSSALNPVYPIGDQLMESASLHRGVYGEDAYKLVIHALEEVQVASPESRFHDYPHQLSGGMKQRIMIAMALIHEPDILIADEPTTALDVTIQLQVLELMKELQRKKQMAILLITHDMGVVAEMADDVIVMYASTQVEKASVIDIFEKKAHPYTQGLFNSRPSSKNSKGDLNTIKGTVPSLTSYPEGCKFHPRCPYVMDKCRTPPIPNFEIEPNHSVKCLLYDGSFLSLKSLNEPRNLNE
jgi:oligopeptide/dipeptide ABC transporter ATP-binding protein